MATAGVTPPNGDTPKSKREFTTQQKRTFAGLGVVSLLAVIVGVMYVPGMLKGGDPTTATTTPSAPSNVAPAAMKPPTGAPGGAPAVVVVAPATPASPGAATPATAATPAQPVVFVSRSRVDPFKPVYLVPPLAPTPVPTTFDPQISLPKPDNFGTPVSLPAISDPRMQAAITEPLNIGAPSLPHLTSVTGPRDAFPLPRTSGGDTNGAPGQSYDKRLAGVIIGDGVQALLELPSGEQRVVQPGDDVEGIHVISIERTPQGGGTVTRMLVRDTDGTQKYVELRPSSQAQTTGGPGGPGGGAGQGGAG